MLDNINKLRITLEGMENLGTVKDFREKSGCWMG